MLQRLIMRNISFCVVTVPQRRLCFYTCLSVILYTGGGVPGQVPQRSRYTPWAGTTPSRYTAPGRYPLSAGTPPAGTPPTLAGKPQTGTPLTGTPQAGTPQAGTLPPAGTPLAGTPPGGRYTPQTGTVADGTNPTGMHSSSFF